jgi:DNA-binding response OmpR family regulator
MPVLDGFGLAERIRADDRIGQTKLMMLTSAGRSGDGQRCRDLGITGYLSKPASRTELLETVAAVVQAQPAAGLPPLITRHSVEGRRRRFAGAAARGCEEDEGQSEPAPQKTPKHGLPYANRSRTTAE